MRLEHQHPKVSGHRWVAESTLLRHWCWTKRRSKGHDDGAQINVEVTEKTYCEPGGPLRIRAVITIRKLRKILEEHIIEDGSAPGRSRWRSKGRPLGTSNCMGRGWSRFHLVPTRLLSQ